MTELLTHPTVDNQPPSNILGLAEEVVGYGGYIDLLATPIEAGGLEVAGQDGMVGQL